jgi:uncharacterized membrane protein YqiK
MMIDALRSVAAQMTMDELHENRSDFARQVRDVADGHAFEVRACSSTACR